ncbi:hypothetical protein CC80DRAFT_598021 [Byssothecium circinans]|uniref:Uncharacterized protein n=1 Tax=Byssothecium circinans TaxID=147558 RepID=A0A6A5TE63_9PLEO|nr:hypothetical protein CC80DRAFT_598021 [Byssothecium circinans]
MQIPHTNDAPTFYDEDDISMPSDEEVPFVMPEMNLSPIPFTLRDRFIERYVHTICAVVLLPCCIALLISPSHILIAFLLTKRNLVLNATVYNKAPPITLSDSTNANFNVKSTVLAIITGVTTLLLGLFALFWRVASMWIPRDKILRTPPGAFMTRAKVWSLVAFIISMVSFLNATYAERDIRHGSGCHLITNRKGVLTAKCSFESAACYTKGWPDFTPDSDTSYLCHEAKAVRYIMLVIALCTVGLFMVYRHQSRIQLRYTTPEQRERSRLLEKEATKEIERNQILWGSRWTLVANIFMVTRGLYVARRWYNDD